MRRGPFPPPMLRLFVSVPLPPVTVPGLGTVGGEGSPPAHLTLKFLGEVPDHQVGPIGLALEAGLRGAGSFPVSLEGLDAFPSRERPRVLYAKVATGQRELADLAQRVETALGGLGFPPEGRPWVGHLTLRRLRPGDLKENTSGLLRRHERTVFLVTTVRRVELVSSELNRQGAVHKTLAAFPLPPGPG
jgi:2'-5' RNA ligase